jgi:hypothetical protein
MKMNCLESILILSLGVPEYERLANTSASCTITTASRLVPFPSFHCCSFLHRLICIATEALREIPGLVPSNPRRNTSGTLFEVSRSGNNYATRCRLVADLFPLSLGIVNRAATIMQHVAVSQDPILNGGTIYHGG